MAGVNTILRLLGAVLSLFVFIFVGWIGVRLIEPIKAAGVGTVPASLGWSVPSYLFFMGLGLMGLVFTVFIWLWVAPVRRDVRQEQTRRRL